MELLTILNFILFIYLFLTVRMVKERLDKLSPDTRVVTETEEEKEEISESRPEKRQIKVTENNFDRFVHWFRRDWQLKVGAFFVLLGFVWLVSYAFLNNWVGPVGRIVFGLLVGSAVMAGGVKRIKTNIYQGEILAALGAGVVLVSIYAAQYIYNAMFPPMVALALVTCITGTLAYISYVNKTVRLAALGLLVGGIAPMLMAAKTPGVLGLFSYLFCLVVGTIWLVRLTGWRVLTILSIIIIWLYSVPWLSTAISPANLLYMRFFAVTFTVLFYLLSLAAFVVDRSTKHEDAYIGFLIGLYSFHWIFTIVPPEWQSTLCVALAIIFMLGSYVIFRIHKIVYPTYLYTAVAVGFLIAATMRQFRGETLSAALATESLALTIYADQLYGRRFITLMTALYVLPLFFAVFMLADFKYTLIHQFTLLYIGASFYGGALYLLKYRKNTAEELYTLGKVLLVGAGVYTLFYVWTSMPFYLGYRGGYGEGYYTLQLAARAVTLILFALAGIGLYLYGIQQNKTWTRRFGFWLVFFVTGRLLIVEVWDMSLGARIITFFAVGIIFIASVFVRRSNYGKK